MSSKRQTTFAKMERERKVKERRALKRDKKQAAADARNARVVDDAVSVDEPGAAQPLEDG